MSQSSPSSDDPKIPLLIQRHQDAGIEGILVDALSISNYGTFSILIVVTKMQNMLFTRIFIR